ncbi:MAG: hypothetical protein AAFQ17_07935, partial [Pseudomonadota bacterium]
PHGIAMLRFILVFVLVGFASCAPPPTTLVSEYTGRVTGGTLVIAPFSPDQRLDIPRLPGEDLAAADRRYAQFFRLALAREIQRQTRFDRVVVDEYAGMPPLEMQRYNQRRYDDNRLRVRQGQDFPVATPPRGQPIQMAGGTPEFILFFGNAEIEAVRGELLPGRIVMPHRVGFVLWSNETGEPILFNELDRTLTLRVEPLPQGTPLDEQMARSRYLDGLEAYVEAMFGTSPFHVSNRG